MRVLDNLSYGYIDLGYRPGNYIDSAILVNDLQPMETWNLKGNINKMITVGRCLKRTKNVSPRSIKV